MPKPLLATAIMLAAVQPLAAQTLTSTEINNCLGEMYETHGGLIDIDAVRAYAERFPGCRTASPATTTPLDPANAKTGCFINEIAYWQNRMAIAANNGAMTQLMTTAAVATITEDAIKERCLHK